MLRSEQIFRDVPDPVALQCPALDFFFEFFAEQAQFCFDAQARLFGSHAFQGEAELARQRQRKLDFLRIELSRRIVIDRELAGEPAFGH